jgi:multisubunit Na+/H+ antiporter MnhF subunit
MFLEGAAIAVVYFIVKFLEMRFISGETLPIRIIIRDTSFVYLASIIGLYTLKQFKQSDMIKTVGGGGEDKPAAAAFTSNPDF